MWLAQKLNKAFLIAILICFCGLSQSCKQDRSERLPEVCSDRKAVEVENTGIPLYVLQTLSYIRIHNKAPKGYVGGRYFQNREKRLPLYEDGAKIKYREWDVRRRVKGINRGPERLITSDVKAYYTPDHYKTFELIKENKKIIFK